MKQIFLLNRHIVIYLILTVLFSCKGNQAEESQSVDVVSPIDTIATNIDYSVLDAFSLVEDAYVLPWSKLLSVTFEETFVEALGMETPLPVFDDTLKALDGKMVIVEGFFVPVSETGDESIVILSAYPYAQCFFCGKAGVESIIDVVKPKYLPALKLDAKIKLKGKLRLNTEDFDFLIYMLEEAELINK